MLVFNIVLPQQFYIGDPEALVYILHPRLDQNHIDNINQIGQIVEGHPYGPVVRRLIRKSAPQRYDPGVVQDGHGRHGHPRNVDLPVGVDYLPVEEVGEDGGRLGFGLGHLLDVLVGEGDAQLGFEGDGGGFDGFAAAYRGGSRRGFDAFPGGLGARREGVHQVSDPVLDELPVGGPGERKVYTNLWK